jgi:general secretion pathway protein D
VTQDQPQKRRDYEDFVVKTFYLSNVQTVQELQEISTAVRAVTDIRRLFTYNAQNAILVRGSVDQVALAEKLIQDLDKPKGELVLDVIVMEVSRSNSKTLGGSITSGSTNGLSVAVGPTSTTSSSSDSTSTTTSSTTLLSDLIRLGSKDFALTLPGYTLNALMSNSNSKILQSPQVRAVDNMKATLKIGQRVPTATGSYASTLTTSTVNTQFQYIDVGVLVDVTPKVHSADEASLHIELEISSVSSYVDIGGISQPVIGQRKVAHDLRMREGQVTLLGGILQDSDSVTLSGTPGLGNIPLLKYMFSNRKRDVSQQELLIALVPHIVRAPDYTAQNLKGVAAGNDQTVRLSYGSPADSEPRPGAQTPVPAAAPVPGTPAVKAPGATVPAAPPATPAGPPAPPPAQEALPMLLFNTPAVSMPANGTSSVMLEVRNVSDLFSAPLKFRFDPAVVKIEEITQGSLLSKGGAEKIVFSRNIRNENGEATVVVNRVAGSGGASGSGTLVLVKLKAVAPGKAQLSIEAPLRNSQLQPISSAAAPPLEVTVR